MFKRFIKNILAEILRLERHMTIFHEYLKLFYLCDFDNFMRSLTLDDNVLILLKIFEIAVLLLDNNQLHNLEDVISVICYFVAKFVWFFKNKFI